MKNALFISLLSFAHLYSTAQDLPQYEYQGLVAYAELGGVNLGYSVNAEYAIGQWRHFKLSLRAGFGAKTTVIETGATQKFLGIPISIQAYNYLGSNHHTEFGLGLAYVQGKNVDFFSTNNQTLVLSPSFGYRFQKSSGSVFLRLLYTPGIVLHEFNDVHFTYAHSKGGYYHSAGLSLGYFFAKK